MILGSNPAIDNTLNLPSVGCSGAVSTPRFGSPWRVLRAWAMEGSSVIKKKNEILKMPSS